MNTSIGSTRSDLPVINTGWKRFGLGILVSALGGVLLLLSFPPYGLWPLVWIACIPARIAQYRLFPVKWSGLGEAIAILVWLGPFLARLFGTSFGPFFTMLGGLIAILVFFVGGERKFHEQTGYRWFVLNGMSGWVGFEMIRATFIPLVATSGFIGYTLASQTWLIQPVSIFSVYGLNLLIIMVNYSLSRWVIGLIDSRWHLSGSIPMDRSSTTKWLMVSGAALASWMIISLIILNIQPSTQKVKVAAIQPNYSLPAFQDESAKDPTRLKEFIKWVHVAASQGAQIIVTPEMMFNFNPRATFTSEFQQLAKETQTYLFISYTIAQEGLPWHNETVLLGPDGNFYSPAYAKNHIPPGESRSNTAGVYPVFNTPVGRLAAMICHDANYTDVARKLVGNGAQLIAVGLNEFGKFGEQYWTNATFRAVENQSAVVVAARQSGSVLINHKGHQVVMDQQPDHQTILVGEVTIGNGKTIYTTVGDILGWVSLAGMIAFMVYQGIYSNRMKKAEKSSVK